MSRFSSCLFPPRRVHVTCPHCKQPTTYVWDRSSKPVKEIVLNTVLGADIKAHADGPQNGSGNENNK